MEQARLAVEAALTVVAARSYPAMAPAALTVDTFNALCTKSEGRDKVARFFQYFFRTFIGFAGMQKLTAGTQLYQLHEQAGNIMKQLASARRCHRWCKEVPSDSADLREGAEQRP